jgi:hypothetical protein
MDGDEWAGGWDDGQSGVRFGAAYKTQNFP